jgi:hypothetical protein
MKLAFAFLADAADIRNDGQFSVVGGGFDMLRASSFPAVKYAMALVGRVEFEPAEINKSYSLHSEIIGPNGIAIPPDLWLTLKPFTNPVAPNRPNWTTICFNYQGVSFPTPGDYFLRLSIDKMILDQVTISVLPLGEQHS